MMYYRKISIIAISDEVDTVQMNIDQSPTLLFQ